MLKLKNELADIKFLNEAWKTLNKYNLDSHGLSGETIADFKTNIEFRIPDISASILNGSYRFKETRAFLIPKKDDFRPLQIPEISDRLVLKGIALLLERQLEPVLSVGNGVSFAYQKGLGAKDALLKMKEYYDKGYKHVLEADIIGFFPSVNKELLIKSIFQQLNDSSLNELIIDGLNQKVGGLEKVEMPSKFDNSNAGIPQGNPLSPLLSNFFLAPFDKYMKDSGFALIRYADDFIVMCKSSTEAKRAYKASQQILEHSLGLKLYPLDSADKSSKIVKFPTPDFSFLSVSFDGEKLFPSVQSKNKFIDKVSKICHKDRHPNVLDTFRSLYNSLDGWVSTYSFTDVERYFEEIDTNINRELFYFLNGIDWKLAKTGKVRGKYRREKNGKLDSGDCLSEKQRKTSGIPFCQEIYELRISKPKSNRVGPLKVLKTDPLKNKKETHSEKN